MQDRETADEAEEALTDTKIPSESGKKDSSKDNKFAFKKMKQSKKEKADKNKLDSKKYHGEGVAFKSKLIGVEPVTDARGDKMCQEAMQKLKLNVKNLGPHKRKIQVSVSLQGIKIKDEKTGATMYHHPVHLISFISQDIMDARAFGYVFGSTNEPHQFIAIKTEKPAFHVVLAIRDVFQTVLLLKQKAINSQKSPEKDTPQEKEVKEESFSSVSQEEHASKNDNIYVEVLLTEPLSTIDTSQSVEQPETAVADLVDLQDELNMLQEGIDQMETSIATALNSEVPQLENDPFDTSFVVGPKRDSFAVPMPTPIPSSATTSANESVQSTCTDNEDKYAVFNKIESEPSIFTSSTQEVDDLPVVDLKELEEEIAKKTVAPPKPPRTSKTDSDLFVFADLDPLGKDRPYKDKTEFFQDVKNPPKKVLNDLVDPNKGVLDVNLLIPSVPFPVDFEPPNVNLVSSSLPNNFSNNVRFSLANGNDEFSQGPLEDYATLFKTRSESEPTDPALFNIQQHAILNQRGNKPMQQLSVNCANLSFSQMNSTSSSPIPIPPRNGNFDKDRPFSNGSVGSPYSKSPQPYLSESPNHTYYLNQNHDHCERSSPNNYPNGLQQTHYINGENRNINLSDSLHVSTHNNLNGLADSTAFIVNQNGVSRPRPRSSLNKSGFISNGGRTVSSQSLSSDSSSDYEMISRENMQSITNVLVTQGHRLRAQSLNTDSNNEFKLQTPRERNIFAKKNDPFADDFFFSLPKKTSLLTKTEIPECV